MTADYFSRPKSVGIGSRTPVTFGTENGWIDVLMNVPSEHIPIVGNEAMKFVLNINVTRVV